MDSGEPNCIRFSRRENLSTNWKIGGDILFSINFPHVLQMFFWKFHYYFAPCRPLLIDISWRRDSFHIGAASNWIWYPERVYYFFPHLVQVRSHLNAGNQATRANHSLLWLPWRRRAPSLCLSHWLHHDSWRHDADRNSVLILWFSRHECDLWFWWCSNVCVLPFQLRRSPSLLGVGTTTDFGC